MSQRNDSKPGLVAAASWLIRRAASNAPSNLALRLEEEWLADLQCRNSALSRMRFVCGCCWAVLIISRDLGRQTPAANPLMAAGGAALPAVRNLRYLTLRPATVFLILGSHAAIFWSLTTLIP